MKSHQERLEDLYYFAKDVLHTGAAGLGTGAHTALAQIMAEELGLRFEDVSVVHGDTDIVPWDIGAFAAFFAVLFAYRIWKWRERAASAPPAPVHSS